MKRIGISTLLLLAVSFAAACSTAPAIQPTETASLIPPTPTVLPSETPSPVPTETITPSPSPSPLPSKTVTPSLTATPVVAFNLAEVISYSEETGSGMLILKVPGVKQDYNIKVDNFDYRCYFDAQYIDRLFCRGSNRPTFSRDIKIVYYDILTAQEVYKSTIMIAIRPTLWPVVYDAAHNCPDRGKNVTCTAECRISPESGNPCLAASCNDLCGYYFSVSSCPPDMSNVFQSCTQSQRLQQFTFYGIPLNTGDIAP
jgi:hypothetical protein